jgi:hypothetical protein
MSPTPEFKAARRAEQRRRLLTHLGLAEPITLPLLHRPGLVARISLVPLTERHRLELHLAGNAFFTGRAPLLGDVIQFLWRLSPHFRRPDGTYPNQPARGGWLARLRSALERRALAQAVRRCDLFAADRAITTWLMAAGQDEPGAPCAEDSATPARRSHLAPQHCFADELVEAFAARYQLAPATVLDLPVALVNQLLRARLIHTEDGELALFAPSDSLLSS